MPSAVPRNRQVRDTARRMSRVDRGAIKNWRRISVVPLEVRLSDCANVLYEDVIWQDELKTKRSGPESLWWRNPSPLPPGLHLLTRNITTLVEGIDKSLVSRRRRKACRSLYTGATATAPTSYRSSYHAAHE